jgi:hypothetical protein
MSSAATRKLLKKLIREVNNERETTHKKYGSIPMIFAINPKAIRIKVDAAKMTSVTDSAKITKLLRTEFRKILKDTYKKTYKDPVTKKDRPYIEEIKTNIFQIGSYDLKQNVKDNQQHFRRSVLNPALEALDKSVKMGTPEREFLFGGKNAKHNPKNPFIHIGHVAGYGYQKAQATLIAAEGLRDEGALTNSFDSRGDQISFGQNQVKIAARLLKRAEKLDTEMVIERDLQSSGLIEGKINIAVAEPGDKNQSTGGKIAAVVGAARRLLNDIDWFSLKGSDSFVDLATYNIEQVFLEKKLRRRKTLSVARETIKTRADRKNITLQLEGVLPRGGRRAPPLFDNLMSLKNIINANLHDVLQADVMGKGGAKELLNYRTGRFAMSARVLNLGLGPSGGSLQADITWMHVPYDEFLPGGGPLAIGKPLRNPQLLIGRAVRIILRDLGLQRMSNSLRTRIV